MKIKILIFLLIASLPGFAQIVKPAKWSSGVSKTEVKIGETIEVIVYADVQSGWYIYAVEKSPAEYAPQTVFNFENPEGNGYKLVGQPRSIGVKEKNDEYAGGIVKYLTGRAEYRQKIKITDKNVKIKFSVEAQVCSTSCVPVNAVMTIDNLKIVEAEKQNNKPDHVKTDTAAKVETTAKTTDNGKESKKPSSENKDHMQRVEELEKEKQKLTGKKEDESVLYLKKFVNKYGGK